jgi:hypothetical protein
LDGALATVSAPDVLASVSVICSESCESTTHPAGTGMVTPLFDAIGPPIAVGDAIGLGDPAGLGLGRSAVIPALTLALPLWNSAIAVPQPAITTSKTAIALTIRIHGVR